MRREHHRPTILPAWAHVGLHARRVLALLAGTLAVAGNCLAQAPTPVVHGRALPGLEAFDAEVVRVMQAWAIPGASLAVAKDGRLVLAKGYGVADRETGAPVTAQTLFRMGSINKTLTAVAILQLLDANKLSLDDKVIPLLAQRGIVATRVEDPRVHDITVHHLLQHSAGFDRERSGDPFFGKELRDVARRQEVAPVTCEAIIKDSLERRLDFTPGERFAYSNTGYCTLGRVIEAVTQETYTQYISRAVLQPSTGKSLVVGHSTTVLPDETKYHPYPGQVNEVAAPGLEMLGSVSPPYGSYSIENMDALGAWVATPTEVLQFFLAIDGARGVRLVSTESVRRMQEAPVFPGQAEQATRFYGLGVRVVKTPRGNNWWHGGTQPGVETFAMRAANGYAWVIAFNSRPAKTELHRFFSQFDQALWNAARAVEHWPQGDLF